MPLNSLEVSWDIWRKWRATGRRFLPSQLLAEPQWLLEDIITLDAAYGMDEEADKAAAQAATPQTQGVELDNG